MDTAGKAFKVVQGGTMLGGRPKESVAYVLKELSAAVAAMKIKPSGKIRDIQLPDVNGSTGVRLFIRLPVHPSPSHRVPVVKAISMGTEVWSDLTWSGQSKAVSAKSLLPWLKDMFPPAMKEMVGPNVRNEAATGTLTLKPAGKDAKHRYAILSGKVDLVLAGRSSVTHTGTLELVLTYPLQTDNLISLQGTFRGSYPEGDPRRGTSTVHPYTAAVEFRG